MNDKHAKQSTDDMSGQNTARKEDLHAALLHSSNPAFHTLKALGIKGDIQPLQDKKTIEYNSVEVAVTKNRINKERSSLEETLIVENETVSSKKQRRDNDELQPKKKKRSKKSKVKSKKKLQRKTSGAKLKKKKEVKQPTVTTKKQLQKEDFSVQTIELSGFSQWLSSLTTTVAPQFGHVTAEVVSEDAALTQPRTGEKTENLPKQDLRAEPVVKKQKQKKKKRRSRVKTKKDKKRSFDSEVVLSDNVFSETLADLLALQGHKKQALLMYEKMSLIYPEKSRFFAAKIEELNKK